MTKGILSARIAQLVRSFSAGTMYGPSGRAVCTVIVAAIGFSRYPLTCPSPKTTNFCAVNSRSPIGP